MTNTTKKCTKSCSFEKDWDEKCWNGIQDENELCKQCPIDFGYIDASQCPTCGNGILDEGEDCDYKMKNNTKECTVTCTFYDPNHPTCGNGVQDPGEECDRCPQDLGEKCIPQDTCWNHKIDGKETCYTCPQDFGKNDISECWECGNGIKTDQEECDYKDPKKTNRWDDWCSFSCKKQMKDTWKCNPIYDGKFFQSLVKNKLLCEKGDISDFAFNQNLMKREWKCIHLISKKSIQCSAKKSICDNGIQEPWENCKTCPQDVKDKCVEKNRRMI